MLRCTPPRNNDQMTKRKDTPRMLLYEDSLFKGYARFPKKAVTIQVTTAGISVRIIASARLLQAHTPFTARIARTCRD